MKVSPQQACILLLQVIDPFVFLVYSCRTPPFPEARLGCASWVFCDHFMERVSRLILCGIGDIPYGESIRMISLFSPKYP